MPYMIESAMQREYVLGWVSTDDLCDLPLDVAKYADTSSLDLKFTKKKNKGKLSSFPFGLGGKLTCSQEMKDIVEIIEPGIHQLIPVSVFNLDGSNSGECLYLINLMTKLDFIDYEKSNGLKSMRSIDGREYHSVHKVGNSYDLWARSEVIGDKHFWRSAGSTFGAFRSSMFCSDYAYEELARHNLTNIEYTYINSE